MSKPLQAPFPYFGGKSTVANEVWQRFGNVAHYVEPFAAVLLARPDWAPGMVETINDADGLILLNEQKSCHLIGSASVQATAPIG